MDWRAHCAIGVVILLVCVSGFDAVSAYNYYSVPDDLNIGPYVDKVVYKVIPNQDQRILAMQAGEIEMDTSFWDPVHLPTLDADPDIDIFSALRNGYGHLTLNCRKYPLNISAFRRAFAFAFDKTRVTAEIMDGFSQEHDSLVPYVSGWCIEDDMPYHYYTEQADIGNQILDDARFQIDPVSGFRLAPDGSSFEVVIEYAASSPEIAGGTAQIGVDALWALDVEARTEPLEINEYVSELDSHGNFDIIFYATNFYSNDVDWLAYDYWSEYADKPYQNPSNFRNATYDSWRYQLLYGITYEDVYEAAAEMQMILQYNVPRLVVYEKTYMQGYRNDQFEGHVKDLCRYIAGPWTLRKIKPIGPSYGGTVPIAIPNSIDTFNLFTGSSAAWLNVMDILYSSLFRYDPLQHPIEDLATNFMVETHHENPSVPDGHQRYKIDLIQNATWSDGHPLTAFDVVSTITYMLEAGVYEKLAIYDYGDLFSAYALGPHRLVIEFSTESYWHFSKFAFMKILPAHIFGDGKEIDFSEWEMWNPIFDPSQPHVTCGPYEFTDYEDGEFYELTGNQDYHWLRSATVCPPVDDYITFNASSTGNIIQWTSARNSPGFYTLYMNSVQIDQGVWVGEVIWNLDNLPVGTYEFTLEINFNSGQSSSDTVWVDVGREEMSAQRHPQIQAISAMVSIASLQVIAWVVIVSYRERRDWLIRCEEEERENQRDYFAEVFGTK